MVDGSRRTSDGGVVAWRLCDVGEGPYDGTLPFLIQWTTPMEPGPADGAIVAQLALTPPDADRLADLLLAVGFVPSRHWPRRMFHEAGTPVVITLGPADEPPVSLTVRVPHGGLSRHTLDGVAVTTFHDRRRLGAGRRGGGPRRRRGDRRRLGHHQQRRGGRHDPVARSRRDAADHRRTRRATDDAHEVACIDDAFVLALSGGVYVVREGEKVVTRGLDGRRRWPVRRRRGRAVAGRGG